MRWSGRGTHGVNAGENSHKYIVTIPIAKSHVVVGDAPLVAGLAISQEHLDGST